MNILFDIEIRDYDFFHSERTGIEIEATEKIRNFIAQRISVLKDKIETEESQDETTCAIIYIDPTFKKFGRVEFNYSDNLTQKMKDCFSENDWNYLATLLLNFN